MKTLVFVLLLLVLAGSACAQDKLLITMQRPVADLVYTLGGKLGYNPGVNNAQIISAALADRTKSVIVLPAGGIEITEPIIWPARTGITLVGAGCNRDRGDNAFGGSNTGGTCTRLIARFDTSDEPMIRYDGMQGRISGITFQGYRMRHASQWNVITAATDAEPIVCTNREGITHDLVDGDQVHIYGATGNTAINGTHYVDVLSTSTFALYSNSGLTTPVAGNGTLAGTVYWNPVKRPLIGIHVRTLQATGVNSNVGKLDIRNCSFHDIPVPMLFGTSMDDAYENKSQSEGPDPYPGWKDEHADASVIDNCWFHWPFVKDPAEHRTAMYFRTIQAVAFDIRHCFLSGVATEFLYVERGGGIRATLNVAGDCDSVLRIAETSFLRNIDVWMDIDGSAAPGSPGRKTRPLIMDQSTAGGFIRLGGNLGPASGDHQEGQAVLRPQFLIRGTAKVNIEHFNGLVPNSIQQVGNSFSTTRRPALTTLRSCTIYGTSNPSDVFTATSGDNASVAPYLRKWDDDCQGAFRGFEGNAWELLPIEAHSINNGVPIFEIPEP